MKLKYLFISLLSVFTCFLTSCTVSDPNNSEYAMDPNVKIALIVICSLITAGILGYGIYFYIKTKKKNK